MKISTLAFSAAIFGIAGSTLAQNQLCGAPTSRIYGLSLVVGQDCDRASFGTAQDLFDALGTPGLSALGASYDGTQVASLDLRFNSLPIQLSFPNSGFTGSGAELRFVIPALGVNQVFNGADRDVSRDLLEDYLKNNDVIGRIMKYQAEHSPHSPITGPGGLIPTAVAGDFGEVFNTLPSRQEGQPSNQLGVGLGFSSLDVNDLDTKVTTLPLSYTIRNNIDPRRQLVFSLPITVSDSDGAKAYSFSLGAGYRYPLSEEWTLTPALRVGVTASEDLATVAGVVSASLASTYVMRFDGFDMAVGNMLGYYTTTKVKSGDYAFNPKIDNTVLRNGVMLSQPVTVGGSAMSLEYSLIDTRYLGTEIYVDNTQELGITLGTNRSAFSSRSFLRGGLNFMRGRDTRGVSANIGYWF